MPAHDHEHEDSHHHQHDHSHQHGHEHDQGITAMLRYAKFARRMWRSEINDAVVQRLAPKPGETLVDIGAGVGAGTVIAAAAGANVIAVEPTGYMRRILAWRSRASSHRQRISIVDGSAEAMGVPDGSVDGAWAVNTMHHWTDVDAAVVELARVLAPGGRVLLVDENFDDPSHPDHESFTERHSGDHAHHFHMVDPGAVADKLRNAGLQVAHAGDDELIGRPVLLIEVSKAG